MSYARVVAVGTASAVQLNPAVPSAASGLGGLTIRNGGANPVFLGGPDVTSSGGTQGFTLAAGATVQLYERTSDLWAISGTGTNNVDVLRG